MQEYNISNEQVQKVMVVDSTIKRRFQVVLDSNNTNSFTGSQFNATYYVDFKTVVREAWRLKKSYLMTFEFVSRASTFAVSGITSNKLYQLHIDMAKAQNIYKYSNAKVPSGIVRTSTQGTGVWTVTAGVADVPTYFDSRPDDNTPTFIDNLLDITTINLNLLEQPNYATFNTANDATINTATKYVCIITLTEA
jgi:hypothetical protein